jgi:hypothetical protein
MRIRTFTAIVAIAATAATFSVTDAQAGALSDQPGPFDTESCLSGNRRVPEGTVIGTAQGRMQCIDGQWVKCEYHGTSCGIFGPITQLTFNRVAAVA